MQGMYRFLIVAAPLLVAVVGCQRPQTATQIQLTRMDQTKQGYGSHFDQMVDNAILRDMSVADIHFIPHTNELSGIGVARLDRLARLLQVYGGTVRYETLIVEEKLIEQRLDHVKEYLSLAGCDMDRVEFAPMMSGGRGLPGGEAVEAINRGTAAGAQGAGGSTLMALPQGN